MHTPKLLEERHSEAKCGLLALAITAKMQCRRPDPVPIGTYNARHCGDTDIGRECMCEESKVPKDIGCVAIGTCTLSSFYGLEVLVDILQAGGALWQRSFSILLGLLLSTVIYAVASRGTGEAAAFLAFSASDREVTLWTWVHSSLACP
eukprot:12390839-Ditylum_brightwellii.AAC.1